ncbi:oxidoreductase [Flavobacterium sp. J372]|uniref:sialidase family protein n=2 Tax=Flavobacterium sp. J372 TaxID=2898436 RepID=UPI002150A905|nr:oxidoreductase [Flavobacterium sp. J372]MCR5863577.1 oxidoreductase [Flavobacterium sp. J372]
MFLLNAGTPALLYKVTKDTKHNKLVYTETGEKVFYDSMKFRNDDEGIAIGDPVNECLSVIFTRDGGNTWKKMSCIKLPMVEEGEACFAASNTNLVVHGNKTWIISGGKKSRVFYSADKGENWSVTETPILQGDAPTGMFSVDFYDDNIGFAVGGDYSNSSGNKGNKILTEDGGKSWKVMADGTAFGYASCVQFVPKSDGDGLVTVGPSGVWYSYDRGATWKKIHDEKSFHTIRFINDKSAIAAGQNSIVRLDFK